MRFLWSLSMFVLLAAVLSGCLGGGDDPGPAGDDGEDLQAGMGSIAGRVFTMGLDEVADARVMLTDGDTLLRETTTRSDGRFRIDNVEPGTYRVQVNAPCCRENLRVVTVVEGETAQADIQVERFTDADLKTPRVEQYQWSGLLACGYVLVIVADDACSGVDEEAERTHSFELGVGVKTVTAVLVWDATGGLVGEELQYGLAQDPCTEGTGGGCATPNDYYGFAAGSSPLQLRIDGGNEHQSFAGIEEPASVQLRVFPPFWNLDVFYQQKFTVYYELHYHEEPPEDYETQIPDR